MNVIIQKKGKVENLEKSGIIKLDKVMNNSTTIKSHIATSSKQPLNARGFPHDFVNKIICGDVVEIMKQIPEGSVDVVVASPPYNSNIHRPMGYLFHNFNNIATNNLIH